MEQPTEETIAEAKQLAREMFPGNEILPEPITASHTPRLSKCLGKIGKFMVFAVAAVTLSVQLYFVPVGLIRVTRPTGNSASVGQQFCKFADDGTLDPGQWGSTDLYGYIPPLDDEPPTRPIDDPPTGSTVIASTSGIVMTGGIVTGGYWSIPPGDV